MFKSSTGNRRRSTRIDTLIGRNTRVKGDISFTGGLHVVGHVEGNVQADNEDAVLSIADEGRIEGEVRVPHIVLDGTVQGDVHAGERVELGANAKVIGDVYYNLIEMAVGASVNGKLVHKPKNETRLLSHSKGEKSAAPAADKPAREGEG